MKKNRKSLAFFITLMCAATLVTLAGCASLPSGEEMKAQTASFQLPKLPDPGKALVYVIRPGGYGGLIRFNVFVDDQEAASEMGYTKGKQYIYFHVSPGKHTIYSKAENWALTDISAQAGEVIFIKQDPSFGVIMARNSISRIDEVPGKYHVKTLELGTIIKTDKSDAPEHKSSPAIN
jgi:hypothetical protein